MSASIALEQAKKDLYSLQLSLSEKHSDHCQKNANNFEILNIFKISNLSFSNNKDAYFYFVILISLVMYTLFALGLILRKPLNNLINNIRNAFKRIKPEFIKNKLILDDVSKSSASSNEYSDVSERLVTRDSSSLNQSRTTRTISKQTNEDIYNSKRQGSVFNKIHGLIDKERISIYKKDI